MSSLSAAGARRLASSQLIVAIYLAAMMILGASMVPARRGLEGDAVGAAMGFAMAAFPLLIAKLAAHGQAKFAARMMALGMIYCAIAAAIWLAFPGMR
jgi:hypothetical protein